MDMLLVNLVLMGYIERDLVGARRVLRGRLGGDRRADSAELSGRRPRRVPHRHRRPRRGGDQGVPEEGPRRSSTRSIPGVPASLVGREQEIEVGPMSGKSNVVFWLEKRGLPVTDELVERIFAKAKASTRVLERRREILEEIAAPRVARASEAQPW